MREVDEIRSRYARRSAALDSRRYSMLAPGTLEVVHERQRQILRLFRRVGLTNLSGLRLVEVGAGTGGNLLEFLRLGFSPENISGIELLPDRVEIARRLLPSDVRIETGDASEKPIASGSVDIVYQAVVFSSLLDSAFQVRLADSMWRWLRPGGGILWYDFAFDNPSNPDVRGMPISRVRELFPEGSVWWRRVTLAPPLARLVTAIHPALYTILNALPLLRTHRLCWISKK